MNELGKFEGKKEPNPEESIEIIINDLVNKVEKYTPEELEIVEKNLSWTIEGDKRGGLLEIIKGTKNLAEAEMLEASFREAEKEIEKKKQEYKK